MTMDIIMSLRIEDLRKKYDNPIIGMEPAVKPAVRYTDTENKKVLVRNKETLLIYQNSFEVI